MDAENRLHRPPKAVDLITQCHLDCEGFADRLFDHVRASPSSDVHLRVPHAESAAEVLRLDDRDPGRPNDHMVDVGFRTWDVAVVQDPKAFGL